MYGIDVEVFLNGGTLTNSFASHYRYSLRMDADVVLVELW